MHTLCQNVQEIFLLWIEREPQVYYEYRGVPGTIEVRGSSLALKLREIDAGDEIEILMQPLDHGWQLRSDSFEDPAGLRFEEFRGHESAILSHRALAPAKRSSHPPAPSLTFAF